jgi:hypothetical protein
LDVRLGLRLGYRSITQNGCISAVLPRIFQLLLPQAFHGPLHAFIGALALRIDSERLLKVFHAGMRTGNRG